MLGPAAFFLSASFASSHVSSFLPAIKEEEKAISRAIHFSDIQFLG